MKEVALITGASSGLGKALAEIHAKRGGDLVIVARGVDKLNEIKQTFEKNFNVKVYVLQKDLSNFEAAEEIYKEIQTKKISIDYLINNAGLGGQGYFHERTMEQDINLIMVDIIALTKLTKLFLRDFVKRGSGKILNVSSTAALMPAGPMQATYYAAKSYVTALSDGIWQEIQGTGVTITTLMPGGMDTGFAKASNLENTVLAKSMTFSPDIVAKDGYEAMLRGDMEVVSKLTPEQEEWFKSVSTIPKEIILKQLFDMQK
ncbi:MAG: SDR family NAD(P)-dependent oxidoreductase [Selenomonadaceae bacterium]|nr:SDR family NAD(P)-dependent oxidoreductase [Selenomonadaceae bacterium]